MTTTSHQIMLAVEALFFSAGGTTATADAGRLARPS